MACRLIGAKPLSKPMLGFCQLEPQEQISVKFESKYKTFHLWKNIQKCRILSRGSWVNLKNKHGNVKIGWLIKWPIMGIFNETELP